MSHRLIAYGGFAAGLLIIVLWGVRKNSEQQHNNASHTPSTALHALNLRSSNEIISQAKSLPQRQDFSFKDFLAGKFPKLNQVEIDSFLTDKGRSTLNLIAASRLLNDLKYVHEACRSDPSNPLPWLEIALRAETSELKASALATFRQLAPDNSLGDYLAAHQSFESGNTGQAGLALAQSLDNPVFADYSQSIVDASEQAFLNAGYDPPVAAVSSLFGLNVTRITTLLNVSDNLFALQTELIRIADFDAVEPTVQIGLTLGQRIQDQGPYLIDQVVGIRIERQFLQQLDPLTLIGSDGQSAGERLELLSTKILEINTLVSLTEKLFQADESTRSEYFAKLKSEGELAALRWYATQK